MKWFAIEEPFASEFSGGFDELKISETTPSNLLLARLLTGTCRFKYLSDSTFITDRLNFTILPFNKKEYSFKKRFKKFLKDSYSLEAFSTKISDNKRKNKVFFDDILLEMLNCYIARSNENYTVAFLHIYRFLESISFAFPQIYAVRERDFKKTYKSLRGYFTEDKNAGELNFFKQFCIDFLSTKYGSTTLKVTTTLAKTTEEQENIWDEIRRLADNSKTLSSEIRPHTVEIDFVKYGLFIIELRNRYFHYLRGTWQENISSIKIPRCENLFRPVVDVSLNWIGILYMELLLEIL